MTSVRSFSVRSFAPGRRTPDDAASPRERLVFQAVLCRFSPVLRNSAERGDIGYADPAPWSVPGESTTMSADYSTPPLALRPRDAARVLCVSPRTLWGWTQAGIVPCVRVGTGKRRTVLYPVADLHAWLAGRSERAKGGGE